MSDTGIYPKPIEALIAHLRRLPGIGRRTAERLALALLEWTEDELAAFGSDLAELRHRIRFCAVCGNLATGDRCGICQSANRDQSVICVVENAPQIPVIEAAGCFHGLYHVLGGRIMPLEGKGPEDLRIEELRSRVEDGTVKELIIATSPDVEGEATAHFLADEFAHLPLTVTRIAAGVPVGADLSYADAATMAMAIGGRRSLK